MPQKKITREIVLGVSHQGNSNWTDYFDLFSKSMPWTAFLASIDYRGSKFHSQRDEEKSTSLFTEITKPHLLINYKCLDTATLNESIHCLIKIFKESTTDYKTNQDGWVLQSQEPLPKSSSAAYFAELLYHVLSANPTLQVKQDQRKPITQMLQCYFKAVVYETNDLHSIEDSYNKISALIVKFDDSAQTKIKDILTERLETLFHATIQTAKNDIGTIINTYDRSIAILEEGDCAGLVNILKEKLQSYAISANDATIERIKELAAERNINLNDNDIAKQAFSVDQARLQLIAKEQYRYSQTEQNAEIHRLNEQEYTSLLHNINSRFLRVAIDNEPASIAKKLVKYVDFYTHAAFNSFLADQNNHKQSENIVKEIIKYYVKTGRNLNKIAAWACTKLLRMGLQPQDIRNSLDCKSNTALNRVVTPVLKAYEGQDNLESENNQEAAKLEINARLKACNTREDHEFWTQHFNNKYPSLQDDINTVAAPAASVVRKSPFVYVEPVPARIAEPSAPALPTISQLCEPQAVTAKTVLAALTTPSISSTPTPGFLTATEYLQQLDFQDRSHVNLHYNEIFDRLSDNSHTYFYNDSYATRLLDILNGLDKINAQDLVKRCKKINSNIKKLLLEAFQAELQNVNDGAGLTTLIRHWFNDQKSQSLAVDQQRHIIPHDMTATREKMRDEVQNKILALLVGNNISNNEVHEILNSFATTNFKFTATFLDELAVKINQNVAPALADFFTEQYRKASSLFSLGCNNKAAAIAAATEEGQSQGPSLHERIQQPRTASLAGRFTLFHLGSPKQGTPTQGHGSTITNRM